MYNSISTAIYQVIVMLIGFVTPRVMLSCYGSEINGLVSSINQFITYFNVVEAGLAGASIYALYKPLAEKDFDGVSKVVSASKKFYTQSGYIFTLLIGGLALVYPLFVEAEKLSSVLVAILIIVLGSKGFLEFFTLGKYRVILTADQRTYIVSIASSVYVILNMIIIVILSTLKANVVITYSVAILAIFARSLILMIYVKKKYPFINYKAEPNTAALDKRWDALFLQILQSVQTGAPVVIITVFLSLKQVSVFTIYNMVLTGINGVLSIFTSGLAASFGELIVRGEKKTLQRAYQEFEFIYYMLITVIYSIAMVMILPFISLYTHGISDTNYIEPMVAFLIVLNGLLYNLKTPQGMLIISAGHYKETRIQNLIQGAIIVILGSILTYIYGIAGVLIGMCVSNLYRDIDLMFYIPKHITKLPWSYTAKKMCGVIGIFSLISFITFSFINIKTNNYLEWVLLALIVGTSITFLVLTIAVIFDKKQCLNVITRVKGIIILRTKKINATK